MSDLNPSDHTVKELKGELDSIEDPDVLESIHEAEIGGKDRKTAKKAVQDRLDALEEEGVIPDEDEAETESEEDATSSYEEEADADAEPEEAEAEEEEAEEEEDDGLDHPTADKRHVRALNGGTYRDMWVYCENHDGELLDVSREMLGKARDLMDQYNDDYDEEERVVAVLVGSDVADLADDAIAYGADVAIYHEDDRLERFRHKPYTEIVADMARGGGPRDAPGDHDAHDWRDYDKPRFIQFPATNNGRDISAQVQAELDSGLASDCNELYIENELISNPVKSGEPGEKIDFERIFHMKRPDFSGFEWSTILCIDNPERDFHPQGCSVIPGSFPIPEYDDGREGQVVEHDLELDDEWFRVDVTGWEELDSGVDLSGHDVIVALGRGIGDDPTRGVELGLELCNQFEDAELGVTRGIVTASYQMEGHVEKYTEEERQIGETGQVVEPDLYIAAGISGAIQHKVGMDESDTIIAINTDPDAQIKDFSDYFIVGDLFEEIPRLVEALEAGELPDAVAAADGGPASDDAGSSGTESQGGSDD